MALQSSGSITARDIASELGYTQGASTKIGDYRLSGGQNFGGVTLPVSENVPTSGQIKFSDFYEARRTLVVDYYSANENKPQDAKDRFSSRSKIVVGNFVGNDNDTTGKKVVIVVNKDIGSNKSAQNSCALRTGSGWSGNTVLEVLVGSSGEIIGAGGNGGNGGASTSGSGGGGGAGSSGLGVQHEGTGGTRVTIQSGGRIAAGGGGGGGGGGAFVEREERWGGPRRYANGSGGGGGAGLPSGSAGSGAFAGTSGSTTTGGVGGATNTQSGGDYGARGGAGGAGGNPSIAGGSGVNGQGFGRIEGSPRYTGGGGGGGSAGAAIRRNSGFTVVIQNLGPPSQLVGDTSATGIS